MSLTHLFSCKSGSYYSLGHFRIRLFWDYFQPREGTGHATVKVHVLHNESLEWRELLVFNTESVNDTTANRDKYGRQAIKWAIMLLDGA